VTAWWREAVVYQVYPRSFRDGDGDGVGDLAGVLGQLDYLSGTLGIDAVWLSPFYPSPMADFGYDVADYCDVDPLFGDLPGFDRLLAAAHERGLRLIVDLVPNHTSDRHPWFIASRSSRLDPRRDWYVWRDAGPGGRYPNNWQAVFGGPAWEWDEATRQYYLHSFLAAQPDLNWRNPAVREAIFRVMRFWLGRGVDGFRIDVADFVMKDPGLRDDPPPGSGERPHSRAHPDLHGVFREMRRLLDGYAPPRMAVGEIHEEDLAVWASYYGAGDELHLPFNFSLLHAPWEANAVRRRVEALEAALPAGAWPNYVLGNHDEPRLASRLGEQAARVAAMLLLTLRGTPTLYYGDELGLPQLEVPPERQQDPFGRRVPGRGRDGCRTPMPWERAPHAGFCPDGVEPWLPLGEGAEERSVAAQLGDPRSLLNLYRALLALRRARPALRRGGYRTLPGMPAGCFAYRRALPAEPGLVVALNFTPDSLEVAALPPGSIVAATGMDRAGEPVEGSLRLGPHEGVVLERVRPRGFAPRTGRGAPDRPGCAVR
jgi:glycosidase